MFSANRFAALAVSIAALFCCLCSIAEARLFYVEEADIGLGRRYKLAPCPSSSIDANAPTVADCLSVKTVAVAEYNKTLNETGWDYLYLRPSPMFSRPGLTVHAQAEAYRAVGYLEGYLTADRMWSRYSLTIGPAAQEIMSFIDQHMDYMKSLFEVGRAGSTKSAAAVPPSPNPPPPPQAPNGFLAQLQKIWRQLEGLHEGYNDYVTDQGEGEGEGTKVVVERMSFAQIFVLSYQPEMGDVQNYLDAMEMMNSSRSGSGTTSTSTIRNARGRLTGKLLHAQQGGSGSPSGAFGGEHCSGFVKPTVDENGRLTDLFASQASWFWYTAMWRQYKVYNMDVGTVAMSSYPGALVSQDDWYATSHGLATLETTIASSNLTNYLDGRFGPDAVSEWIRCMIANYLGKSAPEWATLFSYLNSGSYNNQWMIVDMKLFPNGETLQDLPNNLMWLCETLPGIALCDDMTSVLRQQGYWASYNIPYFPEIYVNSGYSASEVEFGSFFSYTKYCRAQIFKRNHTLVTDLDSMRALMRYNDFQNDPMSDIPNCTGTIYNNTCRPKRSAMLSVASRGDLDPQLNSSIAGPLATLGWVGQQNVAAIDCKIASWSAMMNGATSSSSSSSSSRSGSGIKATAISGPTTYQQPVFQFSTAPEPLRTLLQAHQGDLPDRWDFPWQEYDVMSSSSTEQNWERAAKQSFRGRVRLEESSGAALFSVDPFVMTFSDNTTLALIEYNATMNQTGWDVVVVTANPEVLQANATLAYYGAGYLEGYATAPSILENYLNYDVSGFFTDPAFAAEASFVREQLSNARCLAKGQCTPRQSAPPDPKYFQQLRNLLAQLQGLCEGYNNFVQAAMAQAAVDNTTATTPSSIPLRTLTEDELYLISFFPEMPDVDTWAATNAVHPKSKSARPRSWQKKKMGRSTSHCSALIKPVGDDLFAAQATWANYNFMLRQYKSYIFEVAISFSSYPGMLQSADDWYITSNGLTVMETSNNVFNTALYVSSNFNTTNIPSWLRVMTAMHLATSAQEWQQIFVYLNSGSYNNQWMAVDMKLFTPGTALANLPTNLVWVSETIPGFYQMADVTDVVRQQGYWASYNIPYFPDIYTLSGNLGMEQSYGSYFSYTKYARPGIFKRNHTMVTDLTSMKALMRYNDYQNDPLSDIPNCTGTIYANNTCKPKRSAMLTIAARGDLDPIANGSTMGPLATLTMIGQQGMGAIDCKIASASHSFSFSASAANRHGPQKLQGFVISGPTSQQQTPFQWSTAPPLVTANVTWYGQPELFDFDWQSFTTPIHGFPLPSGPGALVAPPNPAIGVAIGLGVSLLILALGIMFFSARTVSSETSPTDEPHSERTTLLPNQLQ